MNLRHIKNYLIVGMLGCTMALAAIASSISHFLNISNNGFWTEICSVNGMRLVRVSDSHEPSAPEQHAAGQQHCDFCLTQA